MQLRAYLGFSNSPANDDNLLTRRCKNGHLAKATERPNSQTPSNNLNPKTNRMQKAILFYLIILLLACSQASEKSTKSVNSNATEIKSTTDKEPNKDEDSNGEAIDVKALLKLSPLSIFDKTATGLTSSEKEALIEKGKSESWEIIDETKTKLVINGFGTDAVELYFLKNKNNSDGLLAVETRNGKTSEIQLWKYFDKNKSIEKSSDLKKYSANDFVSQEDELPNSYKPQLQYGFVDDQTIEVSLYTWMDKEFENREVINKIFLKWNGESFEEEIVKTNQVQETTKFSIQDKSDNDLSKLNHDGKIVNKRFWQDSNGENIVLFTRKEDELYIYHYAIISDNVKLLRKVYDFERDCDYDLTLEFIANSIKITDLDNNNFGEITFAYKKACISDVSPMDLKLIMLENGNKFIVRGRTTVNLGNEKLGGDKNINSSFKNAPDNFLSHANKIWESINK